MSELCLYNTLSRSKERFEPLDGKVARVYSCGPTVYAQQHLGNLRAYLFADLLKRALRFSGFDVRHVINITDVGHLTDDADLGEDKMELAARKEGLSAWDIADKWTQVFKRDLEKLNVLPPDVWCKATEHIPEQIEMVATLEQKGLTYRIDDGVYFDTSKDPHYGELARLNLEAQQVQERIEGAAAKRSPVDFALWKLSPKDDTRRQMEWDSPWGRGFPGWHLECSAMSSKYLGAPFDIHTGGVDHVPVHHTNEIAQAENALEVRPWVRFWMHGAWLMFEEGKMAKSKGTVMTLDQVEGRGIDPLAYRLFVLGAHYRQQMSFTDEALERAQTAYSRLVRHALELELAQDSAGVSQVPGFRKRFREVINDDLNAPQALAVLWEVVRSRQLGGVEKRTLLHEFDEVLGLGLAEARIEAPELDARIEDLIRQREEARRARDFAASDRIREELEAEGIILEDTVEGTRWRRA
ncbi:MAG: cysteine--tRNA ligase [Myxococcales bacterium]|nr:cysteine--tRNA ligase [Myxococcales bacterium]